MAKVLAVPCRSKRMEFRGNGRSWLSGQISKAEFAKCKELHLRKGRVFLMPTLPQKGSSTGQNKALLLAASGQHSPRASGSPRGNLAAALLLNWVSISVKVQ